MELQRYLRCLGQPVLFAPTGEPVRFRTRKHLALLVYLAVEAKSQRRERMAELLWPKVSLSEARHSLATALSTLRPRLGPEGLESSRDHVCLRPGRVCLDLERLEAGDILGTEITGPLEVAAFLDGFDIVDSAEFTHWKDRQQARLVPMIKDALVVLIDRCRRRGESRQIERLADRMLALDDLSEEAIRAKMEARAFAGDRLTALEMFEEWKTKLADELQAVPSDLVEGMAVRLRRRGWERTTLTNIPNVPTDQWRGRPFIGRAVEYRVLYEAWEGSHKGVPGHALILGDSGVGKTTLVERLTTAAGLEGAAISRVQCYDLEREIPYSTVSSLIRGLLDRPGVTATAPETLSELARMVPEVRHRFPGIPSPSESHGETARIRLTEAFHEMLSAIVEEHPVILVVDDLHLADDVSLAVLHLIMRRARGQQILVLLIARPGELLHSPQAEKLRAAGGSLGIREIDLQPLAEEESLELLKSLLASNQESPSQMVQRALLRAAAGYPMVLELLVHDWQECGDQSLALSVDAMTTDPGSGGPARVAYREILNRITRSLDPNTRNVLNLASILGQRLNDLSMYALVDLSVGQTMGGMAELVARRVLRDGALGLEFVNEMVRAAAYVGVPVTLRKVLHTQIAERFVQEHSRGDSTLGLEVAWHNMRAGRSDQAIPYLLTGAGEATRKGAVHAAERALTSAMPHLAPSEHTEATLLLAEVLQEQGRWLESLELLRNADLERHADISLVLSLTADFWLTAPTAEVIRGYVVQLRAVIEGSTDVSIRIKAAISIAQMTNSLRDVELSKELLRCIADIPTTSLSFDDLACLAHGKARLLYGAQERGQCFEEIRVIAATLRSKGYVNSTIGSIYNGLGAVACGEGRYLEAKTDFQRAYDVYLGLGNDTLRGGLAAQIALCCFRLGQYADAIEWGAAAMATLGTQFAGYPECQIALYAGGSYAIAGDYKRALQAIAQVDSRISPTSPAWVVQAWQLNKADILLLMGQLSSALEVGRQALGDGPPLLRSSFFAGPFSRWIALTTRGTPRELEGRAHIARLLNDLEQFDAMDQVEILCATRVLGCGSDGRLADTKALLEKKLADLPGAITEQLARLGVLSHDR